MEHYTLYKLVLKLTTVAKWNHLFTINCTSSDHDQNNHEAPVHTLD